MALGDHLDGYQRSIADFYRENPAMAYPKDKDGKHICRWCMGKVSPPRRTFCSAECVHEYTLRTNWTYCKRFVAKRDKYICQICRINCKELKKVLSAMPKRTAAAEADRMGISQHRLQGARLYDIDHITPVSEGGGLCGPENLRLLCIPCHLKETNKLRKRLKKGKV